MAILMKFAKHTLFANTTFANAKNLKLKNSKILLFSNILIENVKFSRTRIGIRIVRAICKYFYSRLRIVSPFMP